MGLLDVFNSEEGQQALGLLAAAGPRFDGAGFGQRLMEGLSQGQKWKAQQQEMAARKQQQEYQAWQIQQAKDHALEQQKMRGLASQFAQPAIGPSADGFGPTRPPQFDREGYAAALESIDPIAGLNYQASIQKQAPKMTVVAPGASLVNEQTGKASFTAPKEAAPLELAKLIERRDSFPVGHPDRKLYEQQIQKITTHQPGVVINEGQNGFDNTLKLRTDFRSEPIYKAHQEVQSAYSQIQQSLKMASPAGDLAGATKLMKILDPGSVVRESELGMAMAASGALDRLQNYATNIVNGTKLTPAQRKDFQSLADALYSESASQYNSKRTEYQGIAERNGLRVADVLGNPVKTMEKKPTATGAKFLGFE